MINEFVYIYINYDFFPYLEKLEIRGTSYKISEVIHSFLLLSVVLTNLRSKETLLINMVSLFKSKFITKKKKRKKRIFNKNTNLGIKLLFVQSVLILLSLQKLVLSAGHDFSPFLNSARYRLDGLHVRGHRADIFCIELLNYLCPDFPHLCVQKNHHK